ncbi:MAG: hypothetical protein ACI8PV_002072, partial [Dinoroseobacter sp.]
GAQVLSLQAHRPRNFCEIMSYRYFLNLFIGSSEIQSFAATQKNRDKLKCTTFYDIGTTFKFFKTPLHDLLNTYRFGRQELFMRHIRLSL